MTSSTASRYPLLRLFKYSRPYRTQLWLATLYSILNKLFDLAPPILIGIAIDVLVEQDESFLADLGYSDPMTQLWIIAAITVVVWVCESLFQYLYALSWRNLAQTLQHAVRMDTYEHVQQLEVAYFEDRSTGGLMSILNDDINQLERFLDVGANEVIQLFVTIVTVGVYFMIVAPSVAWLAVLPMPLIVFGSLRFQQRLAPRYTNVREQAGMLNSQLANNIGGIATIKSFTAERYEVDRIGRHSGAYREANRGAIQVSSSFVPLVRMAIMAGFIAILVWGGRLVINNALDVGLYSTLVYMVQRLLWPLTRLGETLDLYQRAMASTTRFLDVLDTKPTILDGPESLLPEQVDGELRLQAISFGYSKDLPVLEDISLVVPSGKTVAFVGATGSGKTTLIKLLLRFYDVDAGRILLDGHDLRALAIDDLRRAVGLVSQDVFLFHGTVRENIAYGSFGASEEQIVQAAKTAEAHEFILRLRDGYDTIVGERGQKLSGGQRQRLSIARAILKDPPILILDEATSSVDNETEAAIQRSLQHITIGRTTIIIAHRLSTVRNADIIYVLEQGQVVEHGRHEDLILQNGVYAELWRIQTGEKQFV